MGNLSRAYLLCHDGVHTQAPETKSLSAVSGSSGCAKCGTSKAGKRSCCARGGAWFKNCGDAGDTKVDHTWTEGVQACKRKLWRDWDRVDGMCGLLFDILDAIVSLHIVCAMAIRYTR